MKKLFVDTVLLPVKSKPRPGILFAPNAVDSITIHWIGPYPRQTPSDVLHWWKTGTDGTGIEASAHYIIHRDHCVQCIPMDEVAWHCGSKGNYSSIGIEVIPKDIAGVFEEQTCETLRSLIRMLRGELSKELPLKRHYDWTKKDCPKWYTPAAVGGESHWEELKEYLNA